MKWRDVLWGSALVILTGLLLTSSFAAWLGGYTLAHKLAEILKLIS